MNLHGLISHCNSDTHDWHVNTKLSTTQTPLSYPQLLLPHPILRRFLLGQVSSSINSTIRTLKSTETGPYSHIQASRLKCFLADLFLTITMGVIPFGSTAKLDNCFVVFKETQYDNYYSHAISSFFYNSTKISCHVIKNLSDETNLKRLLVITKSSTTNLSTFSNHMTLYQ